MIILSSLSVFGQETIVLKNGSKLYGHISNHDFTDKTITVRVDSAIVVESLDSIYYSAPQLTNLSDMPLVWRRRFEQKPELIVDRYGKKGVWLGSVSHKNNQKRGFDGVAQILEVGNGKIKFLTLNNDYAKFNKLTDIDHYEYRERPLLALAGTIDNIYLSDGNVMVGQVVADYPSRLILKTFDGVDNEILKKNIKSKQITPYNSNLDISEQVPYFSRITYMDGDDERDILGIIRETVYKTVKGEQPYYEVVDKDGRNPYRYSFSSVKRIKNEINRKYRTEKDVVLVDDQVVIGEQKVLPTKYKVENNGFCITDFSNMATISVGELNDGKLQVCYRNLPINESFIFVEVSDENNQKKDVNNEHNNLIVSPSSCVVTFSNILMNSIPQKDRFISPLGNVSVKYDNIKDGRIYFLLRKSDKSIFLVKMVK